MDIIWFYLLAAIPAIVGGILFALSKKVNKWEWLANSVGCFILAALFHYCAVHGRTEDVETWSGQLVSGRHHARWQEYYEYAVYRTEVYTSTDSKGNISIHTRQVFDHWEPTTRWHDDEYKAQSNIGTSYSVSRKDWYEGYAKSWGGFKAITVVKKTGEHNSRFLGGDPNDYVINLPKDGFVWPVTKPVSFENKIKATPTTFSYPVVPPNIKVFPYPKNGNPFSSDRLLGEAKGLSLFKWDQMNARLGPTKKVNVVLIGFGSADAMIAQWQEAAWIGGKKNDVVICYGGPANKPSWVRAFGWTDNKTCLRFIESDLLDKGISDDTMTMVEYEIRQRYKLKDWDKSFAHIRVPAPSWAAYLYFGFMVLTQATFWFWAFTNEYTKAKLYPSYHPYTR